MKRFGRRRFLGGSVAVWCVGCSSDQTPPEAVSSSRTSSTPTSIESSDDSSDSLSDDIADPSPFGAPILVGPLHEVRASTSTAPVYVPEARAWLVGVGAEDAAVISATADVALRPGLEHGLLALSQKCPHLGCRVPYCESSGWFECPCHAALFTRTGEQRAGPSPRGMDALAVVVDGDVVSIDPVGLVTGAPVGTVVLEQPTVGPHCVGDGEH